MQSLRVAMEQRDVAALRAAITVAEGEAEADGAVVEVSGGSAGRHTWQPLSKLHTFYTLYTPHPTPYSPREHLPTTTTHRRPRCS